MGAFDQAASKLPDSFGNYTILQHLATGGMAEVYLARQSGLEGFQKTVVIKRVRPELTSDRDITSSFLDEARLVATLQHPNIAQVTEIGRVNNTYFLVMEYVDGADLRELMYRAVELRQRVAIADAIYILIQACVALHYAHEKRGPDGARLDIIHRDVTPSNVLLSHDGAVKVCDFGIAKATNRTTETVRGALKGKYAYMSPEQCKCTALDRRSDIFALGILLYELSTLTRPFTADNDFQLLQTIIETSPPPPSSRVPNYPRDLERIVLRALAKDPDARYPTAQAMQLDLEALAREHKLSLSPVNIARLMADLFNDSADTQLRQRDSAPDYEPLLETAARTLGKHPSPPPAQPAQITRPARPTSPVDPPPPAPIDAPPPAPAAASPIRSADASPIPPAAASQIPSTSASLTASTTASLPPSPSASLTPSPSASLTPSPSASLTPSTSASLTPSTSASLTPSANASLTPSTSASLTPSTSASLTPSTSASLTPSTSASFTPLDSASLAPSAGASLAPSTSASLTPSAQLLLSSIPNAPTQLPLFTSPSDAPTQLPLSAPLPEAPTQLPLTASPPGAPTRVPPTPFAPNAPPHAPLTATVNATVNAPIQLPPTPSIPNEPIQLPLIAAPNAPTQLPLTASAPNAARDAALMTSAPNAPTYVPFGARPGPREIPPLIATSSAAVVEPANAGARAFPVGAHHGPDPRTSRPTALWLIGAFAAALFATGISIAGRLIDRAANAASAALLDADADRIATALDASMRSARLRANAIAATPVLRTAIDTNVATMKDLAEREYAFSVAAGETLEIFQTRNGNATSLLRLPETGPQLQPLTGAAARLQLIGGQLLVIAGAPISTNSGVRGSLAVATRVDLAPATRLLAQHATDASLRGRDLDLRLVDTNDAPPDAPPNSPPDARRGRARGVTRTVPLPITGELSTNELTLVATPVATITTWVAPTRVAAFALAALLVLCYLVSFRRIRAAT